MVTPTRKGNDMEYDLDYFMDTEVFGDEQYVSDVWEDEDEDDDL